MCRFVDHQCHDLSRDDDALIGTDVDKAPMKKPRKANAYGECNSVGGAQVAMDPGYSKTGSFTNGF